MSYLFLCVLFKGVAGGAVILVPPFAALGLFQLQGVVADDVGRASLQVTANDAVVAARLGDSVLLHQAVAAAVEQYAVAAC